MHKQFSIIDNAVVLIEIGTKCQIRKLLQKYIHNTL